MVLRFSSGKLLCGILVITLSANWPSVSAFKVVEGNTATLSCQYSVKRFGLSRVCWGRGCGTFWCSDILVQTDENGVISKVTDRYRLTADILDGHMDLAILNVSRTDSGPYCCRIDIDGIFNDKKVIMNLRVTKPLGPPKTTTQPTTTVMETTTKHYPSTDHWRIVLSSHLDILRHNSSIFHSGAVIVEDPLPTLSLQVNIPVLSLSLSLLILLVGALIVLVYKRGIHSRALKNGCLSANEPSHIIYEIRMRKPVEENIYTLD